MPSFAELPAIKLNCLQMRKMCGVGITSFYQKFRNKISDGIAAIKTEPKYQQWACCEFLDSRKNFSINIINFLEN